MGKSQSKGLSAGQTKNDENSEIQKLEQIVKMIKETLNDDELSEDKTSVTPNRSTKDLPDVFIESCADQNLVPDSEITQPFGRPVDKNGNVCVTREYLDSRKRGMIAATTQDRLRESVANIFPLEESLVMGVSAAQMLQCNSANSIQSTQKKINELETALKNEGQGLNQDTIRKIVKNRADTQRAALCNVIDSQNNRCMTSAEGQCVPAVDTESKQDENSFFLPASDGSGLITPNIKDKVDAYKALDKNDKKAEKMKEAKDTLKTQLLINDNNENALGVIYARAVVDAFSQKSK